MYTGKGEQMYKLLVSNFLTHQKSFKSVNFYIHLYFAKEGSKHKKDNN